MSAVLAAVVGTAAATGVFLALDRKQSEQAETLNPLEFDPEAKVLAKYADVAALQAAYEDANSRCRGGPGNEASTFRACDERNALGEKMEEAGMCHGRWGEAGYQREWHVCGPDSCRIGTGC